MQKPFLKLSLGYISPGFLLFLKSLLNENFLDLYTILKALELFGKIYLTIDQKVERVNNFSNNSKKIDLKENENILFN